MIKRNPLFFAFLFPAVIDGLATVIGQGCEYWSEPSIARDASPAYYFLAASPWLFILGSVVWFVFWYWAFKRLKEPLNLFLTFLFIAGHSWGSSSWLMKIFKDWGLYTADNQPSVIFSWSLLIIYFSLIALTATYCLRIYLSKRK